ncbi:hypothetical protein Aperf_G00000002422 [Anoplocephala perfoliata]
MEEGEKTGMDKTLPIMEWQPMEPKAKSMTINESPTENTPFKGQIADEPESMCEHIPPLEASRIEPRETEPIIHKSSFDPESWHEQRKGFDLQDYFARDTMEPCSKSFQDPSYVQVEYITLPNVDKVEGNQFICGDDKPPDISESECVNSLQLDIAGVVTNDSIKKGAQEICSDPLNQQGITSPLFAESENCACNEDDQSSTPTSTEEETEPTPEELLRELRRIYRKYPKFFQL